MPLSQRRNPNMASTLGPKGVENHYRILRYMAPLPARVLPNDAWYLSIVGILPSAQGRGLGAALLAPTLAEASDAHVCCYLETFGDRNLGFYERLGFRPAAEHIEAVTGAKYTIMRPDA